ncbi:MAG TPA: hypothetical protein VFZ83_06330, partial [Acidimicrobiia bacterium]|nr:hypothetical protein [Acidimicrobiia bacterium]
MTRQVHRWAGALALATTLGLTAAACGSDGDESSASTTTISAPSDAVVVIDPGDDGVYAPELDPADFIDGITHPYLPFTVGSEWIYEGFSDGETERIEIVVTDERKEILGISATVVRDTVYVGGELVEDTFDWYGQDRDGNVWYLGEDSKEYEDGEVVSTAGSWEAGVDGAQPGIVMPAVAEVGHAYRQEFYAGEAEDLAEIIAIGETLTIGIGDYADVIRTREWTPLEPDVVEEKTYAPGV